MVGNAVRVAIALGSNQGNRDAMLREAITALHSHLFDIRTSQFHETDPVGVGDQPRFLNAALTGYTTESAAELLQSLLNIERDLGRVRPRPGAPRTIDLDLIFYGDQIVNESGLIVPHPRFRERRFVLEPLAEVSGDWTDPVTGETIASLLARLGGGPGGRS